MLQSVILIFEKSENLDTCSSKVWQQQITDYTSLRETTYATYTVVYLYSINHLFILFIAYCMMYGVFSDSESIDSDECERVLERFFSKG